MPDLIIRGARWLEREVDLLIRRGKVLELKPYDKGGVPSENARVIDAKGLILLPSLIDAHTHMREPGQEWKEDIASGLSAAAHGGFGVVLCMANTDPVNDNASVTELMLEQAKRSWPKGPRLAPVGALTKGLAGKELAPMEELARAGCVAFSNDGLPVTSTELFRRALEYASDLGMMVIDHCEDPTLAKGGSMNESALSGILGLKGQPWAAETIQIARDIELARYLNIPVHIAHVSTRQSVELIAWAKQMGAPVTAETCPHYLVFDESRVDGYNTRAKVNPPLRTPEDSSALLQALRDGVIDILATDHAPHAAHEKEVAFEDAPFGISGLDTALSVTWGLVVQKKLTQDEFLRAWCYKPASIFGLAANDFTPGAPADFVLFDPGMEWVVNGETMHSKSANTPLHGTALEGRVVSHYIGGRKIV
ncbi:dihydroorotase [Oceanidesulfovibrio indonesiensis]|uniref:Dihydroorotase n=1 Tax=Oceanidesulfovibrio indonesiensis TaxID=54767 RepID=A0A7M3MDC4_9BACT|nr:dihydroorotase [Oceanidesulfovibrio indonesiensis]TVM16601.1 dihydroorotase [Oceanidesulfovibrio indonesiensis]